MQSGIVIFRDRTWVHNISVLNSNRIFRSNRDLAIFHNAFIKLQPNARVICFCMHQLRCFLAWFYHPQRFRQRHLKNQQLVITQRFLGYTMTRLDQGCFRTVCSSRHIAAQIDKFLDIDSVDTIVAALIDNLQNITRADQRQSELNASRPPAAPYRKFARAERYLITGYSHRL